MILVTGAAGKTGKAIINALSTKSHEIRALVHRKEQMDPVRDVGADDIVVGDMSDFSVLKEAVRGAQAVYHICPNVSPLEVDYGRNIIEASKWAGIEHFLYHSVLHPQIQAMPHHWAKMRVEELIFESGLPFTILQPAAYMQNLLPYWKDIVAGSFKVPYAAETRLGMVDLLDVAEAAATVACEAKHKGAVYELVGPDRLSQTELAELLGAVLGIIVHVEQVPVEEWKRAAIKKGMGKYQVDTLASMFRYYDRFGFWGNSMVLSWLLGRKPRNFTAFLQRMLDDPCSDT